MSQKGNGDNNHDDGGEEETKLKTIPFDPRFPQTNQTLACFVNYVDYYRCKDLLGDDNRCEYIRNLFESICPNEWIERWDERRENGTFPHRFTKVPKDYCEQEDAKRKRKTK